MKRFLCILMCMLLVVPTALAADYTPTELFHQQFIIGGNGLRGTVNLTASGVADWVEVLLPFTASELQVRIIGEAQGDMSGLVTDDEDWQVKLFARDSQGEQRGVTWLYGNPDAIWLQSELLPDWLLTLPVEGVHLPYQLADGHFGALMSAFGLIALEDDGGNEEAYSALAKLLQTSEEQWNEQWAPVMEKYYTAMDMWLSAYAGAPVVSGATGSMTLRTVYNIPAADLKAQTKYIVGQMVYDADLQALLAPCFTEQQRSLYLNPALLHVYEHVIDAAPVTGSIILEREMTAMGETIGMNVSLPIPPLPAALTAPAGEALAELFGLPYTDLLADIERISFSQSGRDMSISVASPQRTISLIVDERAENEEDVALEGFVRITPSVTSDEPPLSAAFAYRSTHRIWEDEEYNTHEDFTLLVKVEPDLSLMAEDDPFRSRYLDFAPLALEAEVGFLKSYKTNAPVNLDVKLSAVLPDAELSLTADLKIAVKWAHELLPTAGADNLLTLAPERSDALLTLLNSNAVRVMTTLYSVPDATVQAPEAAPEETPVPPMQ
ncbi:MAG: hypothetical protein IJ343_10310 [Clostridia bacterium]|nr:hypothetical protein [Clostridia bacterium]